MQQMKKKMRLEGKAIAAAEASEANNPTLFENDTVDELNPLLKNAALKKSLLKIKELLAQIQREIKLHG